MLSRVVRLQTRWCTCDEGRLLGVTAQSGDGGMNIYDQVGLFWVQASAVQVPRAHVGLLCAPVTIVYAEEQQHRFFFFIPGVKYSTLLKLLLRGEV